VMSKRAGTPRVHREDFLGPKLDQLGPVLGQFQISPYYIEFTLKLAGVGQIDIIELKITSSTVSTVPVTSLV